MEVKVAPGWANQEAVGAGSAFAEIARSTGREAWIQRYAASEFLWPVNANSCSGGRWIWPPAKGPMPSGSLSGSWLPLGISCLSRKRTPWNALSAPATAPGSLSIVSLVGGACHEQA